MQRSAMLIRRTWQASETTGQNYTYPIF